MDNKTRGDIYEIYINSYINSLNTTKISYLWKDIPDVVLYKANLITCYNEHRLKRKSDKINPLQDVGIDIITVNNDETIIFVQCKNYKEMVDVTCLAGFFMIMTKHVDKIGYVYYSNKITKKVIENIPDRIILKHKPLTLPQSLTVNKNRDICNESSVDLCHNKNIILSDDQKKIIDIYNKYYEENNRAILSVSSDNEKILLSYFISKIFNFVIFISPLKQHVKYNIDEYMKYNSERQIMLINDNKIVDIDDIIYFINNNKNKILLGASYISSDIIYEIVKRYDNIFIIVDGFHNMSYNNIYDNEDPLNKIMNKEGRNRLLFLSATPLLEDMMLASYPPTRLVGICGGSEQTLHRDPQPKIDELEKNHDSDMDKILGKIIYKMDFKCAIKKGYLSNYNIYLPILEDESLNELNKILENFEYNIMNKKCCYLFECIKNFGTLKCIIYFRSHDEINNFIICFNKMNELYYFYDYDIDFITDDDNKKSIYYKLEKFKNNECISLLCTIGGEHYTSTSLSPRACGVLSENFVSGFARNKHYDIPENTLAGRFPQALKESVVGQMVKPLLHHHPRHSLSRVQKTTAFGKNDNNIICSNKDSQTINILDECIDVYGCNSIYMTYNSKSKVKNIHRMLRSMKIDKENPKKIAKIILWCDKIYEISTYINSMKEIDNDYMSKIKYLGFSRNFYEIKNEEIVRSFVSIIQNQRF